MSRGHDRASRRDRQPAGSCHKRPSRRRASWLSRKSPTTATPRSSAGPSFTPVNQGPAAKSEMQAGSGRTGRASAGRSSTSVSRGAQAGRFGLGSGRQASLAVARPALPTSIAARTDLFAADGMSAPFGGSGSSASDSARPRPPATGKSTGDEGSGGTLLVANPRFKLQYAIDDAGPSGPATVELWITQDGGRTWIRRGDDPDRVSPIEVDLGGEGTYGLCLVARSASGLGDQPPAPGDPPQSWVEVDSTPPPSSSSRRRSVPESTPARWRSPGGRAIFTCRPNRSRCRGGGPARARLADDRRCPGERRAIHLDRSANRPAAVSSQGRGRRLRRPSRLGGNDRHGPDHGRSQPAPQPDHRPRSQRPLRHRSVGAAVAIATQDRTTTQMPGPAAL